MVILNAAICAVPRCPYPKLIIMISNNDCALVDNNRISLTISMEVMCLLQDLFTNLEHLSDFQTRYLLAVFRYSSLC